MSEDDRSREQLIEELRDLRQRCGELLNDLPDALFEWDITGEPRLTYMNRMAFILCGYAEEDLEHGIPAKDFFANEEEYQRALELIRGYIGKSLEEKIAYTRSGRQDLHEFRARRKDGTEFCAESQTSYVLDDQGLPVKFRTLIRDITERVEAEREMKRFIEELRDALAHVKTLKGLLPICASCKKVRDDDGYWSRLEAYLGEHSNVEFSHSICPDCMKAMYPV
jgi:PAS domain S-box-containing protein